jgi:hypothetical protein
MAVRAAPATWVQQPGFPVLIITGMPRDLIPAVISGFHYIYSIPVIDTLSFTGFK